MNTHFCHLQDTSKLLTYAPPLHSMAKLIPENTIINAIGTIFICNDKEKSLMDATQLCLFSLPSETPLTDEHILRRRSYPAAYFNGIGSINEHYITLPFGVWVFHITIS